MSWEDRKVFITGATGFIGSRLCRKVAEKGAQITILVRDLHSRRFSKLIMNNSKLCTIVLGNLENYDLIERVLNESEIDTCLHLAAQAVVSIANRMPLSTFRSNITGTWNILEACRKINTVERIIIASSDKVYGNPIKVPIDEEHPLLAKNPYDASKACADILAKTYHETYSLPVAITRCSNIYGGGDLNFSRIVPDTIRSVLLDKNPIIRSDGSPIRDYMYILDAVEAYIKLVENLERVKGQVFNFGTGKPTSVLELVNKIIEISGKTYLKPKILGKPLHEINIQYLLADKANRILNWSAKIDLAEGLAKTIDWYNKNRSLWATLGR